MWMQLIPIALVFVFVFFINEAKAQLKRTDQKPSSNSNDSTKIEAKVIENSDWKTVDINFLSSYYAQDGNNSPVTGGIGTELLTDFTQKIIVSAPITKKVTLKLDGGYDYYTSASTDNIDNIKSSDSISDVRTHSNIGIAYKKDKQNAFTVRVGGSTEYDYNSFQTGFSYSHVSKNQNTGFNIAAQAFIDKWDLIYPKEIKKVSKAPTSARQSYNVSMGLTQILNKRMQISLMAEVVQMNGLLSTPFHRVYFKEQAAARIENLPTSRLKVPIGARLNIYASNRILIRTYYRYYWDNWGVSANTATIELPIKLTRFIAIYPHYRIHTQTAADQFLGYKEHSISSEFYTSDYDLSALTSQNYGIGLLISPSGGIAKAKIPFVRKESHIVFKSIDLKYSHYDRSTGLTGDIVSLGLGLTL